MCCSKKKKREGCCVGWVSLKGLSVLRVEKKNKCRSLVGKERREEVVGSWVRRGSLVLSLEEREVFGSVV